MNRLVVVSNRVPALKHQAAKPGGLAVGLGAALKKRGGLWFGWSGQLADRPSAQSVIAQTDPFALATFCINRTLGVYCRSGTRCWSGREAA